MRLFVIGVLLSALALAGNDPGIVILYQFDNFYSNGAFADVRAELASIMRKTGIGVEWHEKTSKSFPATSARLVIVHFRGHCTMDGFVERSNHGSGALALTHLVNGEVLPFSDVNCDLVRANVREGMLGFDKGNADLFLGRGLGRVVAHELWHILTKSTAHGRHGVTQRCLSPEQLVSDHIEVLEEDLERISPKQSVAAGSGDHADAPAHSGNGSGQL
jgi:hypothetical protein